MKTTRPTISARMNHALERFLPERRVFIRSEQETRFVRLRPLTQLAALAGGGVVVTWSILATALVFMAAIGAGSERAQALREQALYETRLSRLAQERDSRGQDAMIAQERFTEALGQLSQLQTLLLNAEDRNEELERGLAVLQKTISRTLAQRDEAEARAASLQGALVTASGSARPPEARGRDMEKTLGFLSNALTETATARAAADAAAQRAAEQAEKLARNTREMALRNDQILATLEDSVTRGMEPLKKMLRSAGVSTDQILGTLRSGYSGQGGPLMPEDITTGESAPSADMSARANFVMRQLEELQLTRQFAEKLPFGMPVKTAFRFTSGFGVRTDPFGKGKRMHAGTDFAGAYGSPIYAAADGVVSHAGPSSGYGKMVSLRHALGRETVYGHLSRIRVKMGQKVSRGERIGYMGSTGRSTGTHLHYEVRVDRKPVNPMTYLKAAKNVF